MCALQVGGEDDVLVDCGVGAGDGEGELGGLAAAVDVDVDDAGARIAAVGDD